MARSPIQLKKKGNKKSSGGQRFEASEHWKKIEKQGGGSRNPLPTMVMPIKNVIIP